MVDILLVVKNTQNVYSHEGHRRCLMCNRDKYRISETVLIGVKTASKILEIQQPDIWFNPNTDFPNSNVLSMYLKSRNTIVFNVKWLENANDLEILTTCFHESRHAYQYYCIQTNSRESEETIYSWKSEFEGYNKPTSVNGSKSNESYLIQKIEIDAIAFAYHQMKELFDVIVVIPNLIKSIVENHIDNSSIIK